MQRVKIAVTLILAVCLILGSALVADAGKGGKPAHAGPPDSVKEKKAEVREIHMSSEEVPVPPEGETEPVDPYDLTELVDQIRAIKESKPGAGNSWGRIAKELGLEKTPGSTALLVSRLKEMFGAEEEDGALVPETEEPESVEVTVVLVDPETGLVTVSFGGTTELELYELTLSLEVAAQLVEGDTLEVYISADGQISLTPFETEPVAQPEAGETEEQPAEVPATEDETSDEPVDDTGATTEEVPETAPETAPETTETN